MKFTKIQYDTWERREIYEVFHKTTMYTTVNIDITSFLSQIKEQGLRFYPAIIYCIAKVINNFPDYRYAYDKEKNIGIWDIVHPMYTVSRENKPQLFSMAITEYQKDFKQFYNSFLEDSEGAKKCNRLYYNEQQYDNIMGITAMPELHFSSFAFGSEIKPDLIPFVVLGKYEKQNDRVLLPIFGEFAHAVNDGFHITQFFNELEKEINQIEF